MLKTTKSTCALEVMRRATRFVPRPTFWNWCAESTYADTNDDSSASAQSRGNSEIGWTPAQGDCVGFDRRQMAAGQFVNECCTAAQAPSSSSAHCSALSRFALHARTSRTHSRLFVHLLVSPSMPGPPWTPLHAHPPIRPPVRLPTRWVCRPAVPTFCEQAGVTDVDWRRRRLSAVGHAIASQRVTTNHSASQRGIARDSAVKRVIARHSAS